MNVISMPEELTNFERAEILVALDAHLAFWEEAARNINNRAASANHITQIKSAIHKLEKVRGRW